MYYNDETYLFLNGEFVKAKNATIDLYSQTMHYGAGVFEGIRSYQTESGVKIFKSKEHYDRLRNSAEKMHIKVAYSSEEFTQITYELLKINQLSNAYIRPLIYLGANMSLTPTAEVHLMICAWDWGKYLGANLLRLGLSEYQRPNPKSCHVEAKVTGHYINSILATTDAKQRGFDEALLLDAQGNVAEGPGANFFMEKGGVLYTPSLGNILPGITRATVIEIAHSLGIRIEECLFGMEKVYTADSAFYTGTAAEVIGIKSINDYEFPMAWEHSLGAKIAHRYSTLVLE